MSMKLFHGEPNGPSLSALASLYECGLDAELVFMDLPNAERHNQSFSDTVEVVMSVEAEGPVLLVGKDAICDSVFMGCYFDEIAGQGKIRPTDPYKRWEMMTWCRQVIERVGPAASYLGTQAHTSSVLAKLDDATFNAKANKINSADLKSRWIDTRAGTFEDAKLEDSTKKIKEWLAKIEEKVTGSDWILDEFSLADIETFSWVVGMQSLVPEAFENMQNAIAWMERVKNRPSVAKALALAKSENPENNWAPGPEINRWG